SGTGLLTGCGPYPAHGSAHLVLRRALPVFPGFAADARACGVPSERGHSAASTDGHVTHVADRFASMRARCAAAAPDVRSADTVPPVPKYISSGVCPRNAEYGSTRLCSWT